MSEDAAEVKAGFTIKYFALIALVGLIPIILGGVLGYFGNEITRDRKMVEVSTTTSANLVSVTGGDLPGKLDITLSMNKEQKQEISGLFRYTISVANRSAEGIDNFDLFILGPKNISWVDSPMSVVTTPPELATVLSLSERTDQPDASRRHFVVSLLNGGQAMTVALSGFSADPKIVASDPVSAIVEKKDWTQRWVENANNGRPISSLLSTKLVDATLDNVLVGETIVITVIFGFIIVLRGYALLLYVLISRVVRRGRLRGGRLPPSVQLLAALFGLPVEWTIGITDKPTREPLSPNATPPTS